MRLWSINPKYLDAKGLVAFWREALLAQNVLLGKTKGYTNHSQLMRFKMFEKPEVIIATYLQTILDEALKRGYKFDKSKIMSKVTQEKIPVTAGQIDYEFQHLLKKLQKRDMELYEQFKTLEDIEVNPLFFKIEGEVESWEIIKA